MHRTRNLLAWGAFLSLWELSTMVEANLTVTMQVEGRDEGEGESDIAIDTKCTVNPVSDACDEILDNFSRHSYDRGGMVDTQWHVCICLVLVCDFACCACRGRVGPMHKKGADAADWR